MRGENSFSLQTGCRDEKRAVRRDQGESRSSEAGVRTSPELPTGSFCLFHSIIYSRAQRCSRAAVASSSSPLKLLPV